MARAVTIVDYRMGNLASVANAVEHLGHEPRLSSDPSEIARAGKLIVPGVGAFCAGMNNLRERGLDQAVREAVATGGHVLGICLGMQMFMNRGFEFGIHDGLALVGGEARRMEAEAAGLRLPQIGWNVTAIRRPHPVTAGIPDGACFYYVNSYGCVCASDADVVATYQYGGTYAAVVAKDNVVGVQFHPEKSQTHGLTLLRNFIAW